MDITLRFRESEKTLSQEEKKRLLHRWVEEKAQRTVPAPLDAEETLPLYAERLVKTLNALDLPSDEADEVFETLFASAYCSEVARGCKRVEGFLSKHKNLLPSTPLAFPSDRKKSLEALHALYALFVQSFLDKNKEELFALSDEAHVLYCAVEMLGKILKRLGGKVRSVTEELHILRAPEGFVSELSWQAVKLTRGLLPWPDQKTWEEFYGLRARLLLIRNKESLYNDFDDLIHALASAQALDLKPIEEVLDRLRRLLPLFAEAAHRTPVSPHSRENVKLAARALKFFYAINIGDIAPGRETLLLEELSGSLIDGMSSKRGLSSVRLKQSLESLIQELCADTEHPISQEGLETRDKILKELEQIMNNIPQE
jgi:hypothetical protein